jgi:hypothetical protein
MFMAEYSLLMIKSLTEEMILHHNNASSKSRTFSKVIFDQKLDKVLENPLHSLNFPLCDLLTLLMLKAFWKVSISIIQLLENIHSNVMTAAKGLSEMIHSNVKDCGCDVRMSVQSEFEPFEGDHTQ